MKHRLLFICCSILAVLYSPAMLLASRQQEEKEILDARLEGYTKGVTLTEGTNTSLTWMLLIFLAVICVGVLFKNAKRTHLD